MGLGAGLTLRIGVQFNHLIGLNYQPHGIAAGWVGLHPTFFGDGEAVITTAIGFGGEMY